MVFMTEDRFQLTINPSFHTYTMESDVYDELGNLRKEEDNG